MRELLKVLDDAVNAASILQLHLKARFCQAGVGSQQLAIMLYLGMKGLNGALVTISNVLQVLAEADEWEGFMEANARGNLELKEVAKTLGLDEESVEVIPGTPVGHA